MPYTSTDELPENIKGVLPKHAQEIFKEAFNNAHDQYKDPSDRKGDSGREETAFRVAWNAVKQKYEKGDDDNWHEKS